MLKEQAITELKSLLALVEGDCIQVVEINTGGGLELFESRIKYTYTAKGKSTT